MSYTSISGYCHTQTAAGLPTSVEASNLRQQLLTWTWMHFSMVFPEEWLQDFNMCEQNSRSGCCRDPLRPDEPQEPESDLQQQRIRSRSLSFVPPFGEPPARAAADSLPLFGPVGVLCSVFCVLIMQTLLFFAVCLHLLSCAAA